MKVILWKPGRSETPPAVTEQARQGRGPVGDDHHQARCVHRHDRAGHVHHDREDCRWMTCRARCGSCHSASRSVITQVSIFPQLRMFGVVPDLGLVAALAVAWFDGPEAGAWFGFAVGLAFDLFLATPVGLSAISYALVAYALGTIRPMFDGRVGWLTLAFGFVGGLAGGILFAIFAILTGADQLQRLHTVAVVVNERALRRPARTLDVRPVVADHALAVAISVVGFRSCRRGIQAPTRRTAAAAIRLRPRGGQPLRALSHARHVTRPLVDRRRRRHGAVLFSPRAPVVPAGARQHHERADQQRVDPHRAHRLAAWAHPRQRRHCACRQPASCGR